MACKFDRAPWIFPPVPLMNLKRGRGAHTPYSAIPQSSQPRTKCSFNQLRSRGCDRLSAYRVSISFPSSKSPFPLSFLEWPSWLKFICLHCGLFQRSITGDANCRLKTIPAIAVLHGSVLWSSLRSHRELIPQSHPWIAHRGYWVSSPWNSLPYLMIPRTTHALHYLTMYLMF